MGIGLVLIVAIAVAVGVLVFRLTAAGDPPSTMGSTSASTPGAEGEAEGWAGGEVAIEDGDVLTPPAPSDRPAPEGYIRVDPSPTSWSARLGGAMGLVIAVAIGAIVLALSLWTLVSLVGRVMSDAAPPTA